MKHHMKYLMKNNSIIAFSLILLFTFTAPVNFAMASQKEASVSDQLAISKQCCPSVGISYCDLSAGHYVCKSGGYSTCICTTQTAVSAHKQYPMGCCTWHGGVAASTWGQVVCNDGSVSEICSIQSTSLNL